MAQHAHEPLPRATFLIAESLTQIGDEEECVLMPTLAKNRFADCPPSAAAGKHNVDGGEIVFIALLGATAFSSLGMWLGTAISPQQIGLMFSVIVAPMIFFGCAYYPWRGLDAVPVVKYLVLLNPLVYVAEGLRGVMTPNVPHMSLGVVTVALVLIAAAGWMLGMRSFYKRAIG